MLAPSRAPSGRADSPSSCEHAPTSAGIGTIGVRMPDQAALLALLADVGPMAVTSANLTGRPPATSVLQAVDYFGDSVSLYLDAGPTASSTASSIVDCTHGLPRVIRAGTISLADLSEAAGVAIDALGEGPA